MVTDARRQANETFRSKQKADGYQQKAFMLSPTALAILARLAPIHRNAKGQPSETIVVETALAALDAVMLRPGDEGFEAAREKLVGSALFAGEPALRD